MGFQQQAVRLAKDAVALQEEGGILLVDSKKRKAGQRRKEDRLSKREIIQVVKGWVHGYNLHGKSVIQRKDSKCINMIESTDVTSKSSGKFMHVVPPLSSRLEAHQHVSRTIEYSGLYRKYILDGSDPIKHFFS